MSDPIILPSPTNNVTRFQLRADAKPSDDDAWIWPLPRLAGEKPSIVTHVNNERCAVDVGYERLDFNELFVPVYAARAGTISYAARTSSGCAISIDHSGKWSTHYAHLHDMFVLPANPRRRKRARVRAGDVIGYAARSPIHVRFELWKWTDADGFVPVVVGLRMRDWLVLPQFEPRPTNDVNATQAAA